MALKIKPYKWDAVIEMNKPPVIRKPPPEPARIDPDKIGERLAHWQFMTYLGWKPYLGDGCIWLDFRDLGDTIRTLIFKRSLLDGDFEALIEGFKKLIARCEIERSATAGGAGIVRRTK